jgi:hypothetical protein
VQNVRARPRAAFFSGYKEKAAFLAVVSFLCAIYDERAVCEYTEAQIRVDYKNSNSIEAQVLKIYACTLLYMYMLMCTLREPHLRLRCIHFVLHSILLYFTYPLLPHTAIYAYARPSH